jgi:SHAQKYF class myb-like DNA-binding protein
MQQGTWSHEEHDRFLAGVKLYPDGPWRLIARYVGTRSVRQVQTHAQKYHEKIARRMRGLRKERRNHVRKEHRIDGDVFNLQLDAPLSNYQSSTASQYSPVSHFESLHANTFQLPVDDRTYGYASTPLTMLKSPSIQLPPLRLAMPSLTVERDELPEEPSFNYFARTISNDTSASVLV